MTVSSQKLLITMIILNLLIGCSSALYFNATEFTGNELSTSSTFLEGFETDFTDDDTLENVRTDTQMDEGTIGGGMRWSRIVYQMFIGAINPFSVNRNNFEEEIEKRIADILVVFRAIISTLMIIEIYLIIKNKKTT